MIAPIARAYLGREQRRTEAADADPRAAQTRLHRELAAALSKTEVARPQDQRIWGDLEGFREHVVPVTHEQLRPMIERAMVEPKPGIFEAGTTKLFGHTSTKKFIPFTAAHLAALKRFSVAAIAQGAVGLGITPLTGARPLTIMGGLRIGTTPTGVRGGYSSALVIDRAPWIFRRRIRPSLEVLRNPDASVRLAGIERVLLEKKPQVVSGIPEQVAGALYAMLAGPSAERVREALQRIRVYAWSGTPLGPYRRFFESCFGPECRYYDVVSATEGPLGFGAEDEGVYRLALDHALFLFMPPHRLTDRRYAWELDRGETYEVMITSFAGLIAYRTGDQIRVESKSPLRFSLVPRGLDLGVVSRILGPDCTDFCFFERPEERRAIAWIEAPAALDQERLRTLAQHLGVDRVELRAVTAGRLASTAFAGADQGLIKLPRLFRDPKIADLLRKLLSERPLDRGPDARPVESSPVGSER